MYIFVLSEFVLIYYDISMEYYVAVKKKEKNVSDLQENYKRCRKSSLSVVLLSKVENKKRGQRREEPDTVAWTHR